MKMSLRKLSGVSGTGSSSRARERDERAFEIVLATFCFKIVLSRVNQKLALLPQAKNTPSERSQIYRAQTQPISSAISFIRIVSLS
jgi:hypothetical protein